MPQNLSAPLFARCHSRSSAQYQASAKSPFSTFRQPWPPIRLGFSLGQCAALAIEQSGHRPGNCRAISSNIHTVTPCSLCSTRMRCAEVAPSSLSVSSTCCCWRMWINAAAIACLSIRGIHNFRLHARFARFHSMSYSQMIVSSSVSFDRHDWSHSFCRAETISIYRLIDVSKLPGTMRAYKSPCAAGLGTCLHFISALFSQEVNAQR